LKRVIFLIDGFNLYHSAIALQIKERIKAKWLNIYSLCKSYLHLFGKNADLHKVIYFTAIPYYLQNVNPGRIIRHSNYMTCLESMGISVVYGRFKEKDAFCKNCRTTFIKYEEKETDVSIGITLMEVLFTDSCDVCVLMSGDTDLLPAVDKGKGLFPEKQIVFAFPYARKNAQLIQETPGSFSIGKKQYIRHQFPNPVTLNDGSAVYKPGSW